MSAIDIEKVKKLGFGLMRLPVKGDKVDLEKAGKMVDKFLSSGFNYFDTAYCYLGGEAERVVRPLLTDRYPRESFYLASKMPIFDMKKGGEELDRIFSEQLERTGAGYFDFYLLHCLSEKIMDRVDKFKAWDFLKRKKEEGLIRHIGFSFHDSAAVLDKMLAVYTDCEFVQLQINYADWEDGNIQSRLCYETALRHSMPIIVMEPVKGGTLARMRPDIEKIFRDYHPEKSPVSWAMRFTASLDNVITVLSGMSELWQVEDNIDIMRDFEPLDAAEYRVIEEVRGKLKEARSIRCTSCRYCVGDCPAEIPIPDIIKIMNFYNSYGDKPGALDKYKLTTDGKGKAQQCVGCRRCEELCPQKIKISEEMAKASNCFD